jgi:hypothetical protein
MRHVEFESSATTLLAPFTRLYKSGRESVRYLGFIQRGNHLRRSHSSDQPGVEPACLLLLSTFEEY